MDEAEVKKDPVKLHKDSNALYEEAKYLEAKEGFLLAAELYQKSNNFFDAALMLFKAGECLYMLTDFQIAVDYFLKSAELSFQKAYDRFGVSALEYARDCYREMEEEKQAQKLDEKIKEVKKKLESSF